MNEKIKNVYVCPFSQENMELEIEENVEHDVKTGKFVSESGKVFPIVNGVPVFLKYSDLDGIERETLTEYDAVADEFYDNAVDWLFESFYEDENKVRENMIDLLNLRHDSTVLEIGCGTGRDSFRIFRRLGKSGRLFVQDLSQKMVKKTEEKIERYKTGPDRNCETHFFQSTASALPFPDHFFDAVFHFGGFNNFSDKKKSLAEMARITRTGGKIVVGDESIPPWLRGTVFADIVCCNNPLFEHQAPLDSIPVGARDVTIRWILGGCFYLIDFRVDSGTPPLNIDLPHKGSRGGTMRTRFYGKLEGVSPEAKEIARQSASSEGISLHDWLDWLIKESVRPRANSPSMMTE